MLERIALVSLFLASIPASMVLVNVWLYRPPARRAARRDGPAPAISVLIPARDEERNIARAVESVLASRGVEPEVVVMDDHSRDRTAEIVREIAARDGRVRLASAPPLPPGWCGKQHACFALSKLATHPTLVFLDADVRVAPHALAGIHERMQRRGAAMTSGIPRQITGTLAERCVIPLIHFVLLGFLPIVAMRLTRHPAFAAGCGQLMMVRGEAYREAGGHAAIRGSRHDGLTLPRAFRRAGFSTDLFDATPSAECRMYRGAREVWLGLAKNATEGMASTAAILPWTVLLLGGQVLPPLALAAGAWAGSPAATGLAAAATLCAYGTRLLLTARFRQSWTGALLHPPGVAVVVAIQWFAWLRGLAGRDVPWKGRVRSVA